MQNACFAPLERGLLPWLYGAGLLALLLLTVAVYATGLSGPLLLDDFPNLQPLGAGGGVKDWESLLQFVFGNRSGPTGRPVSMLSFLIDAQDWPPRTAALKHTNLMLHLLNGAAMAWLAWLLCQARQSSPTRAAAISLLVAGVWLTHPINVSTTLYVVQRMTQLMSLFALLAMISYCRGRLALAVQRRHGLVYLVLALFPIGLLSVLSKENGALLLLAIVVTETTVFQDTPGGRGQQLWYRLGVLLPLALVLIAFVLQLLSSLDTYDFRPYSLTERLLTECRVLLAYLWTVIWPDYQSLGLFHDDFPISRGLLQPWSTLPAVLLILAMLGLALAGRRRWPVISFGMLWFFAWHAMESTVIPLELYFEHRNYVALLGPLFALCWYLVNGLAAISERRRQLVLAAVCTILPVYYISVTASSSALWSNMGGLYQHWAEHHPASERAQSNYAGFLLAAGEVPSAVEVLVKARLAHPTELGLMLQQHYSSCGLVGGPTPSVADILATDDLSYHYGNLNVHLNALLESLREGVCPWPGDQAMLELFDRALVLPQPAMQLAALRVLYANLHIIRRDLDGALIQLRQAFAIEPRAEYPMMQARLAASAGNYDDALVFLQRAQSADAARRPLSPSRVADIEQLRQIYQRQAAAGAAL